MELQRFFGAFFAWNIDRFESEVKSTIASSQSLDHPFNPSHYKETIFLEPETVGIVFPNLPPRRVKNRKYSLFLPFKTTTTTRSHFINAAALRQSVEFLEALLKVRRGGEKAIKLTA